MMDPSLAVPLGITFLSAGWMVATMIRLQEFLRRRRRKVNPLLLRILIFDYARQYNRITTEEGGRPGILTRHLAMAGLLSLLGAVILVLRLH